MPVPTSLVRDLVARTTAARDRVDEDPFGNPVLDIALAITRRITGGELGLDQIADLIRALRDQAYAERARRLASYVGGVEPEKAAADLAELGRRLAAQPLDQFRENVETTRFTAVFTAHPTFSAPPEVAKGLAQAASGLGPPPSFASHRPSKPTLHDEFDQAVAAIGAGRDALDALTEAILTAARERWPDEWAAISPRPLVLASWVGYDTDGRTDVSWWDTFAIRLRMKSMQLDRIAAQLGSLSGTEAVRAKVGAAKAAVDGQVAACPTGAEAAPESVARFARTLVEGRDVAMVSVGPLLSLLDAAIAAADDDGRMPLCVARSGLASHGLSLSHTQFRLNATQLHNTLRQQEKLDDAVGDPSRRRAMLAGINAALDRLEPVAVDFGALLVESSSAMRLVMTIAQIVKFVDGDTRIRLHVAETENGYTLLCALWLVRLFGVEDRVEISPLFETGEALERGVRVLDEALRSRHWRDYLQRTGVLALEFGYSDSGRYVGQLAASYLIERQRLKIAETLSRHGITGVDVIIFDTHGESIGRGAHPGSLANRLKFLNPTRSRKELVRAGLTVREETAFQGGDGYLLFGTAALATATVARIAEHVFDEDARPNAKRLGPDPVYDDPDFAADFFGAIRSGMEALVEEPGYAALLGTFGPALLDPTGSRPSARQLDGVGGPLSIRHPRELRAIPNNAILQQLGWCANTLQGLGSALARHPQAFNEFVDRSPRFRRAIEFAEHALRHSDLDVLRAVISTLDPGSWLNRAEHSADPDERGGLVAVSAMVESLGIAPACYTMLRRAQTDHLALRTVWRDAPTMAPEELLLHALRIALVQQIWLLAVRIPDFSPRHGQTRSTVITRILRLDIEPTLALLGKIFPAQGEEAADRDYSEPRGLRQIEAYEREHRELFQPIARMFDLVREISTAVTHSVGAFG